MSTTPQNTTLTTKNNGAALPTKSCFTCQNLKTWDYPATREDPEDSGWKCGLKENDHYEAYGCEEEDKDFTSEEQLAAGIAKECPSYLFFDWIAYDKAAADSEPEYAF